MRHPIPAWCLVAAALAGCAHVEYDVLVEPAGEGFHRQVRVDGSNGLAGLVRAIDPAADENALPLEREVKRVAAAYDAAAPVDPKGNTATPAKFGKTFRGATPNDVGGKGFFLRQETRLGACFVYMERLRGRDDQVGQILESFRRADQGVDGLIRWVKAQLPNDPDLPRLAMFLDKEFRQDFKNLMLIVWLQTAAGRLAGAEAGTIQKALEQNVIGRMLAMLIERGYVQSSDLPVLHRAASEDRWPTAGIEPLVDRILTEKIGVRSQAVRGLFRDIVRCPDLALRSARDWDHPEVDTRQQARNWRKAPWLRRPELWEDSTVGNPNNATVLFWSLLFHGLYRDWPDGLLGSQDRATLRLRTGTQPLVTSGQWDAASGLVTWTGPLDRDQLPPICYAVWCQPDEKAQVKHFGRVVLTSSSLADYCLWRKSLTPAEADTWDKALAACRPDRNVKELLAGVRFTPPAADREMDRQRRQRDYATCGAKILLGALGDDR